MLERATGKVQRIVNGALHSTPLDLAVNNASERGLLGIALHPRFPQNGLFICSGPRAARAPTPQTSIKSRYWETASIVMYGMDLRSLSIAT